MLGIRLDSEAEARLSRYAREHGRPKSVVARDWILERLDRESIDAKIRIAAALHAAGDDPRTRQAVNAASDSFGRWLDAEDGGYGWGPDGPPTPR